MSAAPRGECCDEYGEDPAKDTPQLAAATLGPASPALAALKGRGCPSPSRDRASRRTLALLALALLLSGCGALTRLSEVGRPPAMTPSSDPTKDPKWRPMTCRCRHASRRRTQPDALWRSGSRAFFKDQRAAQVGDVITIVVNMSDAATLNNVTTATRTSGEVGRHAATSSAWRRCCPRTSSIRRS